MHCSEMAFGVIFLLGGEWGPQCWGSLGGGYLPGEAGWGLVVSSHSSQKELKAGEGLVSTVWPGIWEGVI